MTTSAISTIIPTYNRAAWVSRAIDSVLSQMAPDDEVIVVDDGSSDNTAAIVAKYGERVKYIRTENRGAGAARNRGVTEATKPLVAFLDSDDEWLPNHNLVLRAVMTARPDLLFCFTNFRTRFPDGSTRPFALETQDAAPPDWESILGPSGKLSALMRLPENLPDCTYHDCANLYRSQCDRSYVSVDGLIVRREEAGRNLWFAEDTATAEEWECGALLARAGKGLYIHFESTLVHHHSAGQLTDLNLSVLAASRLTIMRRIWGADSQFLQQHGAHYEKRLREEQLIKAAGALIHGNTREARRDLTGVKNAPISYRVLSRLPGPMLKSALDSRRAVRTAIGNLRGAASRASSAGTAQIVEAAQGVIVPLERLRSIDIVRGSAMLLVVAAHALTLGDPGKIRFLLSGYFGMITQIASVAFMLSSGMITTYLLLSSANWPSIRQKFLKRGLFLIAIVHPVIVLATYFYFSHPQGVLYDIAHSYEITDTIGLCLILAPTIIHGLRRSTRLVLVFVMLVVAFVVRFSSHPDSALLGTVEGLFFELDGSQATWLQVGWPLIPWLAIFLCGSFVGEMYFKIRQGQVSHGLAARRLLKIALVLGFSGIACFGLYELLKTTNPFAWDERTFVLLYPARTTFLLPCYLGLILGLVAFLVGSVEGGKAYNRFYWGLSVFGRTSLFAFVIQFVIVWTIPTILGLKNRLGFAELVLTFLVTTSICWGLTYAYARLRGRITKDDYQKHLRLAH